MDVEQTKLSTGPAVAKLRYVAAGHVPESSLHNFLLPAMTEFGDERLLPLHSIRPIPTKSKLGSATDRLDAHGFTAVNYPTALHALPYTSLSLTDPELLKQYLIPETSEMIKDITGCKTAIPEALLLRAALWSEDADALASHGANKTAPSELETGFPQFIGFNPEKGPVSPASKIHLDYSPTGARIHIRNFHPDIVRAAADIIHHEDSLLAAGKSLKDAYRDCDGPRWALFSVWRPLKTVQRDPLVVADFRTCKADDYVTVQVKFPALGRPESDETHTIESLVARYSEGHKWYWIDKQTPEEVMVLRFFDSDLEAQGYTASGGVLHSSVEVLGTENEEVRESLEIRYFCIW
jgi:hypothetical protein